MGELAADRVRGDLGLLLVSELCGLGHHTVSSGRPYAGISRMPSSPGLPWAFPAILPPSEAFASLFSLHREATSAARRATPSVAGWGSGSGAVGQAVLVRGQPIRGLELAGQVGTLAKPMLADLTIDDRIVREADGPPDASGPGSARSYPGNPGLRSSPCFLGRLYSRSSAVQQ